MAGFSKVGLHLDLRVQVPPLRALKRIAREAAELGVNTLIVEWEASFPFDRHAVISGPLAYTRDELREFLRECSSLGLEVIPLQQCFGHVECILRHERYADLRESENDLCQVCPSKSEKAVAVFSDIFREVVAMHESPYFHIGGDETYLLGDCTLCRKQVEIRGKSGLYVGYLKQLAEEVIRLGKKPMLWVDMLLKYPEAVSEMPRECVFVDWNYGWPLDRFGNFSLLSSLPFEFWGAVAMRSAPDNHSSHAWVSHLENLTQYIPVAKEMNFQGIIMTSWATSGVYGYEWEMLGRPLALHPLRRTTPHAGLRVFMEAFAKSVFNNEPLDKEQFLVNYGQQRFGFDAKEALLFKEALLLSDCSATRQSRRPDPVADILEAHSMIHQLLPSKHETEFARYQLMVDFAEYQTRVSQVDTKIQSNEYRLETKSSLHRQAAALLEEGIALETQFRELYDGELYEEEIQEESRYRLQRIRNLVEKTRTRNSPAQVLEKGNDGEEESAFHLEPKNNALAGCAA